MKRYNDYGIAALIGFCLGWLALFPEAHMGFHPTLALAAVSVVGFTLVVPLGLLWCGILGRRHCAIPEFGKFTVVGAMNTAIDFGVLNLFMFFSGITSGPFFILAKTIAYGLANLNGYILHKRWTFEGAHPTVQKQYPLFLAFSLIGAAINVGLTALLVELVVPPFAMSAQLWANIASLVGAAGLLAWNFVTYRTYVFPHKS